MKLKIRDLVLDDKKYEVHLKGKEINFSYQEFQILKLLMLAEGEALTREQIIEALKKKYVDGSNIIDVYVNYIQRKLKEKYIHTVREVGYKIK